MASTTTVLGLPYPNNGDVPNVAGDFAALANALDAKIGMAKIAEANGATQSFTGIAASWRHLKLIGSARSSASAANLLLRLNNASAASSYQWLRVQDDAASTTRSSSVTATSIDLGLMPDSAQSTLLDFEIDITNYTETAYKSVRARVAAGAPNNPLMYDVVGQYIGSTAAITRVDLVASAAALATITRCCLYGLR